MKKIFSKCVIVTAAVVAALFIGWIQVMEPKPGFHVFHFKDYGPESKEQSCLYKYLDNTELSRFYSILARSKLEKPVVKRYYAADKGTLLLLVNEDWRVVLFLNKSGDWYTNLGDEVFNIDTTGMEKIKHTLIKWHKTREKKCQTTEYQYHKIILKIGLATGFIVN